MELEEKRKEILSEFLKHNEKNVIEMSRKYKKENGIGALFITLFPNSVEVDMEYFRYEDLDGNFKNKINSNHNENVVFYAVRLYDKTYSFST